MNKKILKIIIITAIISLITIGIMYLIDLDKMKNGKEVIFSTWGAQYSPALKESENNDSRDFLKDNEQCEFTGTIIKTSENSILVEPDEGTNERRSSDKISMAIERPTNSVNDFYVVGNKVKITYDGIIMESYPAQIVAIKIELAK